MTEETTEPIATNEEWTMLFDGQTIQNWHSYGTDSVGKAWTVSDSALYLDPSAKKNGMAGGDLVTNKEYSDFHLKLDWKVAKNGNSGIIFYVKDDPAKYANTYNTGLEMQVLDNEGHPDAKINKHRAGDLYDLVASSPETVKSAGEWNHVEIISQDGNLQLFQNGEKVVETTLWDDNWKAMIAGSKFADMSDWGSFKSGKIALQDHGDGVWYKNIMIKEL
ncbi:3-keto-disaccharide hydrolase [Pontibacter sp. CAU 1760]